MPEEQNKTLILSLQFDTDEGLQRAANFRKATEESKKSLQELNKTIKESGEITEEQRFQREKLEKEIREGNRARAEQLKAIETYIKATKGAVDADGKYNGSINNLRANLSFLTAKWNDLTKSERENAEVGGKMQAEIKSLSDQLKELEGSVGDNRRSVGGYLDAIKQAPGFMGKMSAGMQGLNGVMAANPIGAVMQLIQALLPILNSSGDSADFLAKTMAQINAVIQVGMKYLIQFGGRAVEAGKEAFEAFSNPKQVLIDLSDFIQTNLTNRFKSFGVILEGIKNLDFKKVSDGVIQMGTGVTDATDKIGNLATAARNGFNQIAADVDVAIKAGGKYAEQLDVLEAKERAFGLASAETESQVDRLTKQAKNRTLADSERIALLDKAGQLEIQRNKEAIKLAEDRVKLIKAQNALNQEDSDAQDERLKEAQTKVVELGRQSQALLENINNRRAALQAEIDAEEEKRREEEAAAVLKHLEGLIEAEKQAAQELAEVKELDAKADAEKLQFSIDVARAEQRLRDEAAADEKKKVQEKIALKEQEFKAVAGLANAASEIAKVLAEENEELAVFQKAITGFKIALDMAQAISKLTASSQEVGAAVAAISGPAGVVTGPLATATYYATQISAIVAGIAQAKQLMSTPAPKSTFADGGVLDGPSHAAGGIRGTGRFANVEVEGGEAVISKRATAMYAPLLSIINQLGGGKPLGPTNYAAMGGMLSNSVYSGATTPAGPVIDYDKLAKTISKQPIYVIPTEIRDKANAADARKARAGLGYNRS